MPPGQLSSEETSQGWRAVGDTTSDVTGQGIEPKLPAPIAMSFKTTLTEGFDLQSKGVKTILVIRDARLKKFVTKPAIRRAKSAILQLLFV